MKLRRLLIGFVLIPALFACAALSCLLLGLGNNWLMVTPKGRAVQPVPRARVAGWLDHQFGGEVHPAKQAEVVMSLYEDAALAAFKGSAGASAPTPATILRSPQMWLWPVDAHGVPFAISTKPGPAGSVWVSGSNWRDFGAVEIRNSECWIDLGSLGTLTWLSAGRQERAPQIYPSGSVTEIEEKRETGYALLVPIEQYWEQNHSLPASYAEALQGLDLRPIDGRIAAMVKRWGPIRFQKSDAAGAVELELGGSLGPQCVVVRWNPDGLPQKVDGNDEIDPLTMAHVSYPYWFELKEDGLGPDVQMPPIPSAASPTPTAGGSP